MKPFLKKIGLTFSFKVEDSKLLQKDEKDGSPHVPIKVYKCKYEKYRLNTARIIKVNPGRVMLQIMPYAIAVLLTFLVTLSAFPAITMQVNQSYYQL